MPITLPKHLKRLEAESIEIMREVVAECKKPVMLYSIGKDSSVMLHLAIKAFYPAPLPFPLLHVDTTWKFREMIAFRDETARRLNLNLLVYINQEGLDRKINPFTSGSALHTHVMKTEALKQALDKYGFDAAFGGARRDEEKSRRQRANFFISVERSCLGSAKSASGTLEFVQHAGTTGRIDPRFSIIELDRTRCLDLHPAPGYSRRAPVFRKGATCCATERYVDHGG